VAERSADYFEDTTSTAAAETSSARRSLARALQEPSSAGSEIRQAQSSIAAAADAYYKSEAAVFFVDPEAEDELRAQPDPFRVGSLGEGNEAMAGLISSLEKMEEMLAGPIDQSKAAELLNEAQSIGVKIDRLESDLLDLAGAWRDGDAGNFRNNYFLSSPEQAVARIFQGLLAMSGDLMPERLQSSGKSPAEISVGVRALKEIYLGESEQAEDQPAPHTLVLAASPIQAALTRASIARAEALAGVLEVYPDDQSLRAQLLASLEEVTRQLTSAARSLGIVIVESE